MYDLHMVIFITFYVDNKTSLGRIYTRRDREGDHSADDTYCVWCKTEEHSDVFSAMPRSIFAHTYTDTSSVV